MDPPTSSSNFHHEPTTPTAKNTTKIPNTSPRSNFSPNQRYYPRSPTRTHRSTIPLHKSRNVAKIIKGEIHNVLTVMRSDPRYYSTGSEEGKKDGRSRFEYEERQQISRFWSSGSSTNASTYRGMMRRLGDDSNARWSTAVGSFAAHPILQGLRDLYDVLSTMESDFMDVDDVDGKFPLNAVTFVSPFAAAVCSPDVDAKTTGAALSALHKFIVYGFIGGHSDWQSYADAIMGLPSSLDVIQESITVVAQCIRRCSFEETISYPTGGRFWSSEKQQKSTLSILNPQQHSENDRDMQTSYELPPFLLQPRRVIAQKGSSTPKAATIASEDENVVLKLLSLSVQVLRCPAGRKYLSPHDICGIFDTCLFIFLASGDAKLSLLCSAAADALSHCVIVVFGMGAGRMNDNNHHRARDDDTVDPTTVDGSDSDDEWGERDPAADMDEGSFFIKRDRLSNSEVKSEEPKPDVIRETKPTEGGGKHEEPEPALVSILARLAVMADPLIQQSDTCALSLSLINIALETMADVDALASKYPRLLTIMQNDLCRNLLRVSTSSDLTMLGLALRVIFNLFSSIKHHMKLQLEVFLTSVHLRMLSSSKSPANHQQVWSSSPEHRELALESLLEFCREPGLMMDLYLNYDCDINCTNIFETTMITLAKVANPEEGQVEASEVGRDPSKIEDDDGAMNASQKLRLNILNRLALEGITAVIDSIARRCRMSANFPMIPFSVVESDDNSGILGNTLCIERNLLNDSIEYDFCSLSSSSDMVTPGKKVGHTNARTSSDMSEVDFEVISRDGHRSSLALRERKIRKRRLAKATIAFNESKSDNEWIAELERIGVISNPATPESVALFLHSTSKLDKTKIGEYISKGPKEKYPFIEKVLEEFTQLFDFAGLSFSESLRSFLSTFRLPGEAQCIDRLMEAFAKHLYDGRVKLHLDGNAQNTMLDPPRVGSESVCNSRSGLLDPPTSDEPGAVLLPFKSADAAFILAFSTIMLNTDLHNPNMDDKKRMTLEQFVRNNRGINDGHDLPWDFLEELYYEIRNNEIQVKTDNNHDLGDFDGLLAQANETHVPFFTSSQSAYSRLIQAGVHERDMYTSIASATTRAMSTVFVQSWDSALVMKALNGLRSSANICAYFGLKRELNEIIELLLSWGCDYISSVVSLIHSQTVVEDELSTDLNEVARLDIANLEADMIANDLPPLPGGFISILNSEKSPDQICSLGADGAEGSAAHRGLLSLNYALSLSKNHLSALNEALPTLLEVMFALRDVDALPPRLSDLDDFADSRGNELELSVFAKASLEKVNAFKESLATTPTTPTPPSYSGGFLSMFSFGRGQGGKHANNTPTILTATHPLIKVLKVLCKKASLDQIILKTNDVNMAKRILSSMLSAMYDEGFELELLTDPLYEHNAVFVLELAARLLISNRTHAPELIPLFLTKFEVLFSPKKDCEGDASIIALKYPYLLERIIVTVLRAVIHLYDVPDRGLRAHLVRLMTLIYRLPFSYTKEISDRIGCGSAIILRGCFFLFESPEEWCAVKNLLDMSAQHSRGRLFVFDGIASLVDYTLPVDIDGEATEPYDVELSADGAEAMKCLLLKFLDGSYDDDLSYKVSSMMLMRRVYSRLQSNSQMAPSESVESIDSSKAGSHGQDFEWIKMVTLIYNDVCLSQDIKTAEKGFQSLQEVLLSTKVESIPADQWLTLMQMTCTNPPIITLQGSRISSLSLIGRLFLTLMPELSNQSDNWPQLEDFTLQVAKMVGDNLRSGRSTPLFETTVQTVTNMCNVISMSGFNNGQGINFCAWVGDTLLSELEKVGACGGVDATVVLASST